MTPLLSRERAAEILGTPGRGAFPVDVRGRVLPVGDRIYAVQRADAAVKFGTTKKLAVRLRTIAWSVRSPLALLAVAHGSFPGERIIHRALADYRLDDGREWYEPAPYVFDCVEMLQELEARHP